MLLGYIQLILCHRQKGRLRVPDLVASEAQRTASGSDVASDNGELSTGRSGMLACSHSLAPNPAVISRGFLEKDGSTYM